MVDLETCPEISVYSRAEKIDVPAVEPQTYEDAEIRFLRTVAGIPNVRWIGMFDYEEGAQMVIYQREHSREGRKTVSGAINTLEEEMRRTEGESFYGLSVYFSVIGDNPFEEEVRKDCENPEPPKTTLSDIDLSNPPEGIDFSDFLRSMSYAGNHSSAPTFIVFEE